MPGKSIYKCFVDFNSGVAPQVEQRGAFNSVGSKSLPHFSH